MEKPCEQSCPKCGSTDAIRNWHPKGKTFAQTRSPVKDDPWVHTDGGVTSSLHGLIYDVVTRRELVASKCRCCSHTFYCEPLTPEKTLHS